MQKTETFKPSNASQNLISQKLIFIIAKNQYSIQSVYQFILFIKNNQMIEIQRIIPKNLVNQLQFENFQVGLIQAKHANKVIQLLKGLQTLPIDAFFLKRVRKNKQQTNHTVYVEVLLCLTNQKQQFIKQIQDTLLQAFQENILKQVLTMSLPRYAPASKKDFQEWAKYWPCNYIEPQFMKKIDHSNDEIVIIEELHKVAIQKRKTHNSFYLFSPQKYLIHFQGLKGQFSCTNPNPLQHPIIKIAQKWPKTDIFKQNQGQFYYFTGLRMIVCAQKLCGMCAMGLVHSRIDRLYFEQGSIPSEEILEILHSLKLNHKIDLLKVKTPTQNQFSNQTS